MITLGEIKQDYKEVTDLMANYTFSLESIKELNDHLHRIGHETLIEINGEPIDEIESIKDSEIKWVRLDDYNNLCYIYFNNGWQTDTAQKVMFDAFVGSGKDDYFIEDLKISELDDKYVEYLNDLMENAPDVITPDIMADLSKCDNWKCRREAAWSNKTPAEVLEKLANDPDESVRQAVAVNYNTPLKAMVLLCKDKDIDVRNYAKEGINKVFLYSVNRSEFEKTKKYIADYLQSEYSSEADFSNLFHIGIGYTEIGSEEQGDYAFQVEADLINCEINYYIDGEIAKTEKYDSLAEMNECRLSCLEFDDLLHIGTMELDRILEEKEKAAPVKVVLAVSQYDTNRYYIANNATEAAVRNIISNSDKIFMDLCALGGKQIDEAAFAKYSQTEGITAIDVNIDGQIMHVYDAEKPINTFDDIRSNKIRQSDFINQLDEVIATCQKMKEALINGEVDLDRDQHSVGQER